MGLGQVKGIQAPAAPAAERCGRLKLQKQHTGLVPDPAVHNNRLRNRLFSAEFQVVKIHFKVEILAGIRSMQNSVYVQTHGTPHNDTNCIIEEESRLVKHFLLKN